MAALVIGYLGIGIILAVIGVYLRAKAWKVPIARQLVSWLPIWLTIVFLWPFGIDLIFSPRKPPE